MANLVETDATHVRYKDENNEEHDYAIIAVVTLPDEEIEKSEGKERKLEKTWEKFYRNAYKDLEIVEDVRLVEDENDVLNDYEDDQYLFVNFESLASLTERKRNSYSVGLRYAEEDEDLTYQAKSFSSDFVESLEIENTETLDKGIPFEYIEESQDRAIKQLKILSKENERRLNQEEDKESRIEKRQEKEDTEEFVDETQTKQIDEEDIELENQSENDEENDVVDSNQQQDEEDEYEEEYEEVSKIEELQNDLYNTIDNLVPAIYFDNIDIDLEFKNKEDGEFSAFSELENLTINNVRKSKTRTLERLQEERQSTVDRLYRQTSSSLYKRFTDLERLINYESPESEYHNEFLNIKSMYDEVQNSIEKQREDKFAELTRKFEDYKERMAKHAYEEKKAKIEQEERVNVEREADEYKDTVIAESENIYENELARLDNDINATFESRSYGIVDEVLDQYQSEIDTHINSFRQNIEQSINQVLEKYNSDMKEVQNKIQEIQKDHIQNETEFDRRVETEVSRMTQSIREESKDISSENKSMKDELERLRRESKKKEAYIENLQLENQKKEDRLSISEKNEEHYKSRLMGNNHSIGYDNRDNTNFSNVVAPQIGNSLNGDGNRDNVVATEKVVTPLKYKLKQPLMIAMYVISIGSVGLLGASAYEHNQVEDNENNAKSVLKNIDSFKDTNNAKYLGSDTTLTIRGDDRLKPSQVVSDNRNGVQVKSNDGKTYTLSKE
ncbi:hypothetical protein [Staphylococcus equorum]|uniref:hypothetical protein n=1 Tax=Staphylococcus equorum TaxID=246432 RepID=UPI003FD7C3CE